MQLIKLQFYFCACILQYISSYKLPLDIFLVSAKLKRSLPPGIYHAFKLPHPPHKRSHETCQPVTSTQDRVSVNEPGTGLRTMRLYSRSKDRYPSELKTYVQTLHLSCMDISV